MREAARFLETLSDILDLVVDKGMESEGLPLLLEAARKDVETVRLADPNAEFEIGEGDVFWRGRPLAGTVEWEWRKRLLDAGVARMAPPDDATAFLTWLGGIREALVPGGTLPPNEQAPPAMAERETLPPLLRPDDPVLAARQAASASPVPAERNVRPGGTDHVAMPPTAAIPVESTVPPASTVRPPDEPADPPTAPLTPLVEVAPEAVVTAPPGAFSLDHEAEQVWWLHGEAANRGLVPRRETEELIERLIRVLRRGPATAAGRSLEVFDELTTVHLLNVALLAMALGKHLAFDENEVRALGLAGLYHDVGRVRQADGDHGADSASPARRAIINEHPIAGARLLMDSGGWFAVAAVVAYEHHLSWRGTGGYPDLMFARAPHQFSRIVSVCDTYDALRTERPHRPALGADAAVEYLRMLAGKTLDPEIVTGFAGLVTDPFTCVVHPRSRPEAAIGAVPWLPDSGFDPDFEPRRVSI